VPGVSNPDFLDQYLSAGLAARSYMAGEFILPVEESLIEEEMRALNGKRAAILGSLGGGALRGIDGEALGVSERYKSLAVHLRGTIVEYPEVTEERVTLGSRVTVVDSSRIYTVDIVGCPSVHDSSDGIRPASLEAALVQGIIGKRAGETALFQPNGSQRQAEIAAIDQLAVQRGNPNSAANL